MNMKSETTKINKSNNFHLNRWSSLLLVVAIGIIIALIVLTSKQDFWAVSTTVLSLVLGWLLKALSDEVTSARQREWELQNIARERTLNYLEARFSDSCRFVTEELARLAGQRGFLDDDNVVRIQDIDNKFSNEWLEWFTSTGAFVQVLGNQEIIEAYTKTYAQLVRWTKFVPEFNSGKFNNLPDDESVAMFRNEHGAYTQALKDFRLQIERERLKVFRGQLPGE